MRDQPTVSREIASTLAKLQALQVEREDIRRAECDTIVRQFDAGLSSRAIALSLKLNASTVAGILWRSGRTEKARTAIRQRAAAFATGPAL